MKVTEPNVFKYNDYRAYLRDWMTAKQKAGFSSRWFARRAGFKAHNMLQLVATGKRNLSIDSIVKFTRGLALDDQAAQYFEDLVLMNQAPDVSTRSKHYRKLVEYPDRRSAIPFEASQYGFFRRWLGPVVYEMTRIDGFQAEPRWIAKRFVPELSTSEAEAVLSDLLHSGFLERGPDGKLAARELRLDTGDDVGDLYVYAYHEQALAKASDALHWVPGNRRHFQVMTVAVPAEVLPKLREIAAAFEKELWEALDRDPRRRNEVFQISLQIFPTLGQPVTPTHNKRRKSKQ